MSEYTKGPWEWWTSCSWKRLSSKDENGMWVGGGNVLCPTVASDGHPDLIVSEADMRLIAAAPAMYEALKACVAVLQGDTMTKRSLTEALTLGLSALAAGEKGVAE